MLIVETADMLQAPLFTAEALLRAHGGCNPGRRIGNSRPCTNRCTEEQHVSKNVPVFH